MDLSKFQKFIKITKIDDEEHMVYGWASTEDIDSDGEIIKASALEKALPEYLKFPTIREMHQPIAVGKTHEANVKSQKGKKGLYIGAKIVASDAWEKVKAGVYPAFSIGGNVKKRIGNVIHELELVEISLVDVPANKAAVLEVWKRGKLTKDAETAYSMSNLMIQVKDMISYYTYLGKDTKKLKKVLEQIKALLAIEAQEPEAKESDDIFYAATAGDIRKKITLLEQMDFEGNPFANLLRKGVIISMEKKADELNKKEGEEESTEETEETQATEETSQESTEETEATEEDKEAGELATNLKKIADVNKVIESIAPKKEDTQKTQDLMKAVNSIAGSLVGLADAVSSMNQRLSKVEQTPAALKSKSTLVLKGQEETKETPKENSNLVAKKARLAELETIFDTIGKSKFADKGYSQEAMNLRNEIDRLEGRS